MREIKFKVGQTLIVVGDKYGKKRDSISEVEIIKVGRIYLETTLGKFNKDDLFEKIDFGNARRAFLSMEDYENDKMCESLSKDIRNKIGQYGTINKPIEVLQQILELLK